MKLTVKLPNFTLTRGKVPGTGAPKGARNWRRRLRQAFVWGSVGLLFFLLFAWLSLPTRALAWRISHEAKTHGYLIDVEDVSISPFGGITLENVVWTYEPSRPGQVPMKLELEEVEIDVSVMSLLVGNYDVDLLVELDGGNDGRIIGNYSRGSDESSFMLEISDMPLYRVPKATQALNAPLHGILAVKIDLTMPEHKFSQAEGVIELTCAACTIGDGVEKLFVPGSDSLKSGVVIPEIDMGTLSGRMTVEKGVAQTDGPIETKSDDVWIQLSGTINFKDPVGKSRLGMELKFNLSDKLQAESEPMRFMIQTANPKSQLDPPEKGLGFKLEGPLGKPRFLGIKTKSRLQSRADRRAEQQRRDEKRRNSRSRSPTPIKPPGADQKPAIGEPLDVTPSENPPTAALPGGNDDGGGEPQEEPAAEEPKEEPSAEEPPREYPPTEEPPAEEPPAEEPPAEEPVIEEPPPEDNGNQDNGNQDNGNQDEVRGEGGEGGALDEGGEAVQ